MEGNASVLIMDGRVAEVFEFDAKEDRGAEDEFVADWNQMGLEVLEPGFELLADLFDLVVACFEGSFFVSDVVVEFGRRVINDPSVVGEIDGPKPL